MSGFQEVTLSWKGVEYTVPADRQMGLIQVIEDGLTGGTGRQAIGVLLAAEGPSYSRLATAFGKALRYAGAGVTDEEIYLSIIEDVADQKADAAVAVQTCVLSLISIIAPPIGSRLASITAGKTDKKKIKPTAS